MAGVGAHEAQIDLVKKRTANLNAVKFITKSAKIL